MVEVSVAFFCIWCVPVCAGGSLLHCLAVVRITGDDAN